MNSQWLIVSFKVLVLAALWLAIIDKYKLKSIKDRCITESILKGLTILAMGFLFILTGCVKVQLLPEDAVKNTWKAGKDLYNETKLKRQGGKKREYSTQVIISDFNSREEADLSCVNTLKSRLEKESVQREAIVLTERVMVVDGLKNKAIECQVVGFVWPKA